MYLNKNIYESITLIRIFRIQRPRSLGAIGWSHRSTINNGRSDGPRGRSSKDHQHVGDEDKPCTLRHSATWLTRWAMEPGLAEDLSTPWKNHGRNHSSTLSYLHSEVELRPVWECKWESGEQYLEIAMFLWICSYVYTCIYFRISQCGYQCSFTMFYIAAIDYSI